ncbi:MAG: YggT family protein [Blastocatellia bacterium]|nr:YggT family protein [Blastocatellia bacterium]
MVEDNKLAVDESHKVAQHEEVKDKFRREVNAEIEREADGFDTAEQERFSAVGHQLKQRAAKEVAQTEAEIERARGVARVSQVIDYIFYLIYTFIGLEIILELLAARESNAFKNFIDRVTAPLLWPFRELMPEPGIGAFQLRLSYIFALIFYLLLHWMINGLFRLIVTKKTVI